MASVQTREVVAQTVSANSRLVAENRALLQRVPLLEVMLEEAVRALVAKATQVSIVANKTRFHNGDSGDRVFFVCSGEVEIYLTNLDEKLNVLRSELLPLMPEPTDAVVTPHPSADKDIQP